MLARTLLAAIVVAIGPTAYAGTVMECVNKDLASESGGATNVNTWAQNGMLRVETQPNNTTMIFKDDTIFALNNKDKSYYSIDRATMKRLAEQLNPMLKMLQERMKDMTPEQRAQVEKMMGGSLPNNPGEEPKIEIKRTSRTDKIGSYNCSYVQVLTDGVLTDEACVAPTNSVQGADELIAVSQKMAALLQEMMSTIDAPWLKKMADNQLQNFASLGGIPVVSRHFEDGKPHNETTVTAIRAEAVAASSFEIPAGYTRKDLMAAPK